MECSYSLSLMKTNEESYSFVLQAVQHDSFSFKANQSYSVVIPPSPAALCRSLDSTSTPQTPTQTSAKSTAPSTPASPKISTSSYREAQSSPKLSGRSPRSPARFRTCSAGSLTDNSTPARQRTITTMSISGASGVTSRLEEQRALSTRGLRLAYCQASWVLLKLHDVHAAGACTNSAAVKTNNKSSYNSKANTAEARRQRKHTAQSMFTGAGAKDEYGFASTPRTPARSGRTRTPGFQGSE